MHWDTYKQDNYSTVAGDGDVGSVRYEPALLPPCPTIRVLSCNNCRRSTDSISKWIFRKLAVKVLNHAKYNFSALFWTHTVLHKMAHHMLGCRHSKLWSTLIVRDAITSRVIQEIQELLIKTTPPFKSGFHWLYKESPYPPGMPSV